MNPTTYRGLAKVIGKESYLATLARQDLVKQGFTEFDDIQAEKAAEVHEAQLEALAGYMQKNTQKI